MDCIRALDVLTGMNDVNENKIGVTGGSQGGGLTLTTTAL